MGYRRIVKKRVVIFAPNVKATREFLNSVRNYFPVEYYEADRVRVYLEVRHGRRFRRIRMLEASNPRALFKFWSLYKSLRREQWWWNWKLS